jgi:hypothetical protein
LNEEFHDDGKQFSAQIRLRIEMLLVVLEEIETQRRLLRVQQGEIPSGSQLEKVLDLVNRAEDHLCELEARILES